MLSLLFIDDDEKEVTILSQVLTEYFVVGCTTGAEGVRKLKELHVDLVILDLNLPDMDGFAVLEHIGKIGVSTPVIILSAYSYPDNVVRAVRLGASDFVEKPYQLPRLLGSIERTILHGPSWASGGLGAAEESEAETPSLHDGTELLGMRNTDSAAESLEEPVSDSADAAAVASETCEPLSMYGEEGACHREDPEDPLRRFAGKSRRVHMLKTYTRLYADNTEPVLLVGESGTGKDVLARSIHELSTRKRGPYLALNAGAIPEGIIETELFGTVPGAFTGAVPRQGYFEQADGGTLFLDEIGEMPLSAQVKILRILEDGSVLRVGGRRRSFVDVRIICATNRPLEKMVAEGSFRKDLFYRINTLTLPIPPLRERMEDIPELALHFFDEEGVPPSRILRNSVEKLLSYEWPGNTRELRNTVKRAVVLAAGGMVEPEHIFFSPIAFDLE